jgi:hypothetical protein
MTSDRSARMAGRPPTDQPGQRVDLRRTDEAARRSVLGSGRGDGGRRKGRGKVACVRV